MSDAAVLRRMLGEWIRQTGWAYRSVAVWWTLAVAAAVSDGEWYIGFWIALSTVLLTITNILMWMLQETTETVAQIQEEMGKLQPKRQTRDCPDYPGPCVCAEKHTRLDG